MILYNIILVNPLVILQSITLRGKIGKIPSSQPVLKGKTVSAPLLNEKLNTETARISWEELQSHFARGAAVYVADDLDLIETAGLVARDNADALRPLMAQGKFGVVSEHQARDFFARKQEMWAVVVAPWVLVQPVLEAV